MIWEFQVPTRLHVGDGALSRAGEACARHGQKALVVTGRRAASATGALGRLTDVLRVEGIDHEVFAGVSPNPLDVEADEAVRLARSTGCDMVVGLGGGSAIDVAKAVSVGYFHGPVGPLIGTTLPSSAASLPVVAVPTAAGSGAEVTRGALLTDVSRRLKSGIRGDQMFPREAVVDPELSATVPVGAGKEMAFDALAHGVEGLLARKATPLTRDLSLRAADLALSGVRALHAGDVGPDVRRRLSLASIMGGISVSMASTCLPHRLQQAMGGLPGVSISHGRGLAALYPAWIAAIESSPSTRTRELTDLLGESSLVDGVTHLLRSTGLSTRLRDHGCTREHLSAISASVTGNLENDPLDDVDSARLQGFLEDSW